MIIKSFGFNLYTLGLLGALLLTGVMAWRLWTQRKKILREPEKKAESVPPNWYVYQWGHAVYQTVYGFQLFDPVLIINGLMRIVMLFRVIRAVRKVRDFNQWERLMFKLMPLLLVVALVVRWRELAYFLISSGMLISGLEQPIKIIKNRSNGVVDGGLLLIIWINVGFWTIYGHAIGNWAVKWYSFAYWIVMSIALGTWTIFYLARKRSS